MALTGLLRDALAAGFTRLTEGHDAREIVGYGVGSDSDAHSLHLAVHTRTARDESIADDPDAAVDFVWNPYEWDLPDEDGSAHDLVPAANQAIAELDDSDIAAHRETVWPAVVDAMAQLIDERFFACSPEAVRVVLVADGGDEDAQCAWNVRLNGEGRRAEPIEYFGLES